MKILNQSLEFFLNAPRNTKRSISIAYDSIAIPTAILLSLILRVGDFPTSHINNALIASIVSTTAISLALFVKLGLYRAVVRFMTQDAYTRIGMSIAISSLVLSTSTFLFGAGLPRSVPIIYFFIAYAIVGLPRFFLRSLLNQLSSTNKIPVAIYGAGIQGVQLATSLARSDTFRATFFIDDNRKKQGSNIQGLNVESSEDLEEKLRQHSAMKVLLALGSASSSQRKQVINNLSKLNNIEVLTTPSVQDIVSGKAKIEEVRHVEVSDLLGRDSVSPNKKLLGSCITNQVVLITGAGGSIGSEICRQAIDQTPKKIILIELNEYSLYQIEQELLEIKKATNSNCEIVSLLGSVQNQGRLESIFSTFSVDTIYHAAAYKHVPIVEHNIVEGVRNNVFGTWHCAEAAISAGVNSFVLISTDKAVRPTNVMGASKRVAELVLQALAERQSDTRFCMVRFGNVLGSSGSVVPLFRSQIASGGPITVTHPEIIRYFMTIPEASQLVLQAGAMGKGGDVFVLDMGEPVKIYELAQRMIQLSGLTEKSESNVSGDIEIQFTGLRPGEKLYEELLVGDDVEGTEHPRIMTANEAHLTWPETHNLLNRLDKACQEFKVEDVINLLLDAPAAFNKQSENPDWIHNQSLKNGMQNP